MGTTMRADRFTCQSGRFVAGLIAVVTLAACGAGDSEPTQQAETSSQAQPVAAPDIPENPAAAQQMTLPISLNRLMVALINEAADPIWVAAWHTPENDRDWRNLERMAIQLEVGGALLTLPGIGPKDHEWVQAPAWQDWAKQLQTAGTDALSAIKARDLEAVARSGDDIVEICEGCHIAFKPALPTGGEFGELSPTAEDFEEADTP